VLTFIVPDAAGAATQVVFRDVVGTIVGDVVTGTFNGGTGSFRVVKA